MTKTALILGANGSFGGAMRDAFLNAGWTVRVHDRETGNLTEDARGVDVVVAGWNVPYDRWAKEMPGITARTIEAARVSNATILIAGNVYVNGRIAGSVIDEATPKAPVNLYGRIRAEQEETFRASGLQTIVLRMGDFIDTRPSGNWFDLGLTAKVDKGVFTYPGPMDRTHAWAYLPDAARAFVALADMRDRLGRNAEFTYEGYALTGSELHRATEAALGRKLRLGGFPWLAIRAVGLVNPMMRAMASMSYLWRMPHRLSGQALHRLLPEFRETPVEEAVAQALGVRGQKAAA